MQCKAHQTVRKLVIQETVMYSIPVLLILLLILLVCVVYKLCWYAVKLMALKSMLKDFNTGDILYI